MWRAARRSASVPGPRPSKRTTNSSISATASSTSVSMASRRDRAASVRAVSGIRAGVAADADAICGVYNEGVEDRVGTFQTWPSEPSDFVRRLAPDVREPLLVAVDGADLMGWAGVIPYSERPFYSGIGEYQVYVARAARGRGVGTRLLTGLADAAEARGYWKLVGKLFATNGASIALARACGFREVGLHRRHGQLDGEWL